MNQAMLKTILQEAIAGIAPDFQPDTIDPTADLREELDLDSMDISNLLIALHDRLGVDIPEVDAPKLVTLQGALDYLAARLPTE